MFLTRLIVRDIRNLSSVELSEFKQVNIFRGKNAAGKTAFLEAIYLLSVGRSFRTRSISSVIARDKTLLSVYGECLSDQNQVSELGLSRDKEKNFTVRINGESSPNLASLSYCLPTLLFNSDVLSLIEGPSTQRLNFIDWGVFHVKHSFLSLWRLHKKHLGQRNNRLKQAVVSYDDISFIDEQLASVSLQIENLRYEYLKGFLDVFFRIASENGFSLARSLKFTYIDGWRLLKQEIDNQAICLELSEEAIIEKQKHAFERDAKKKFSSFHAGKSELLISFDGQLVKEYLSRGEMKTLCFFLKVAQALYLKEISHVKPVFLVDDLGAELDQTNFDMILNMLIRHGFQSFISITETIDIDNHIDNATNVQMFHVEHGKINPL